MANTIRLGRNALNDKQWGVKDGGLLAVNEMTFDNYKNRLSPVEFSVVRATTATRVNELGLIESVAANVPRIDFQNDAKGELLVEPERSNYIQFGNLLTDWTTQAGATITTGQVDMMGGTNAVRLQSDGTAAIFRDFTSLGFPDSVEGTISCWIKATSSTSEPFRFVVDGTEYSPNLTATNEWQKFSFTFTNGVGPNNSGFIYDTLGNPFDIIIFLPQMEVGEYPTSSIINYTNGLVTRNADVMSASGLGNVLGDSEGGIFLEWLAFDNGTANSVIIDDGSFSNRIQISAGISNDVGLILNQSSNIQAAIFNSPFLRNTFYKTIIKYALNDFAVYNNGNSYGTDTSGNTFTEGTLNRISLISFLGRIRQIVIFDQAPTNAELEALTTP